MKKVKTLSEAGRIGGLTTARRMTKEQLSKRGKKAVMARWKYYRQFKRGKHNG